MIWMLVMVIEASVSDGSISQHLPSGFIYLVLYTANRNLATSKLLSKGKPWDLTPLTGRCSLSEVFATHLNHAYLSASNSISERRQEFFLDGYFLSLMDRMVICFPLKFCY